MKELPIFTRIASQIAIRHDAEHPKDTKPNPGTAYHYATPFKPPGLPPLGRACCAGYCSVHICDMFRILPQSVFDSTEQTSFVFI